MLKRLSFVACAVVAAIGMVACSSQNAPTTRSEISTTDIPQTSVKRQSIGNCWMYATLGWVESLVLRATKVEENFSETYMTYRYFQEQLLTDPTLTEIQTGGNWDTAMRLLRKYGLVREGDFIPEEADAPMSQRQANAERYINESLKSGALAKDRSPATVIAELNKAFGVDINTVRAIPPSRIIVGRDAQGKAISLDKEISRWTTVWVYGDAPSQFAGTEAPVFSGKVSARTERIFRAMMRALNDYQPVVISWFVDFNALDSQGIFRFEPLRTRGPGRQGYHMTVVEDYVVEYQDPVTGEMVVTPEGDLPPEKKDYAARNGKLKYLVVKNSWGARHGSYTDSAGNLGYHRIDIEYLLGLVKELDGNDPTKFRLQNGLTDIVLPAQYLNNN